MSGGIVATLAATSLLMVLVLLIRAPVARAFGARAAYALWLAPLARLLLPPLPAEAVPIPTMWIETGLISSGIAAPTSAASLPFGTIALAIWLGGAALFLAWHLAHYRRFLASALKDARPVAAAGVAGATVLESPAVSGPAATGLLVRRIFVPAGFGDRFDAEERALALMHEALHHRRGDLWASAIALVVLSLHWFNPLAHAAHRAFRRDLEAACDATLLDLSGSGARHVYARTILRCVAQPMPHPSCALTHIDELKGRLEMLTLDHGALRRTAGMGIAAALLTGGLLLAQPATAQEPEKVEKVERIEIRKKIVDGKEVTTQLPADIREKLAKCDGEAFEAEAAAAGANEKKKTRVMLCAKPGSSKAEVAAVLEKALSRLEGTDELPAENKAEIVAKLKSRIAELRSGN